MSFFRLSPLTRHWASGGPLLLESGARLDAYTLAYRTWGELAPDGDNAVVVCHALTGSADADDWWKPMFGPGSALDAEQDFIICSNALGGCYGSTGPTSAAPDGAPWGARFPFVTLRDQVRAQMALADALGVRRIRLVIGGSMGGLQALEWALLDAGRVEGVAAIAVSAVSSPWALAWSATQRFALATDPKFAGGTYDPADPPVSGLAAARAIAMVTYRSPGALARRFPGRHAVGDWLAGHGRRLVERFDANTYIALVNALDSHDLSRGRGEMAAALAALRQPVLVGSVNSDALYLPEEQESLAHLLPNAHLVRFDSEHGHDGFLIDAALIAPAVRAFRDGALERRKGWLRTAPRRGGGRAWLDHLHP